MSHLSFVQCEQIKFRLKKNVKMKASHSVVAVGIVAGGRGLARNRGGGGGGGNSYHVTHDMNFWWSGGAMVLGKLPVPGRPTIWITVGQGLLRLQ